MCNPARYVRRLQVKNAVVWSEIAVADLKRATAFYEKLLDGKLKQENFGPFRIALFPAAEGGVGGCLVHGEGYEPSRKGTVTYFAATPVIDAALERARSLGAKVLMAKTALPGEQGYIAHVADSEGNRIGLHAMS
jgi:predicted enzyme related to lactoylglutathione lyase